MTPDRLRIFISSPGDVAEERVLANRLVRRLSDEFLDRLFIEPVFWEHEPLLASSTFQNQIPPPAGCQVAICILWSRVGTRLPADITRADGSRYASGTEYEFEDAFNGRAKNGYPDLLVYRKTTEPQVSLNDKAALLKRVEQKEMLDAFIQKWFFNADGTLKAAFHQFESPSQFELILEEHLRKLILRRLPAGGAARPATAVKPSWSAGSPFRGLDVFEFEHAAVFFGRTQAVADVLASLRKNAAAGRAFVLIAGVSGGGKSSLARAGVLPVLVQPGVIEGVGLWRRAVLKPSDAAGDLLRSLASALLAPEALPELAADGTTVAQLADLLRGSANSAFPLVKGALSQAAAKLAADQKLTQQPEARLVLLVDQLEELFTLANVTPRDRETFIAVLSSLARSGKVWVIATLRGDFYHRAFELPELVALVEGFGQYALPLPAPAEIAQMIRMPARAAGLTFEEDPVTHVPLDDVVREAASSSPESLPLMEFALEELYQRRTPEGVLSYAAYKDLGGVEGALARRADMVFDALPPAVQQCLPRVMRGLVSIGSLSSVTRQQAALESVAPTLETQAFVEAFVQARLFTADRTEDGKAVVRVTHEALLRNWPRIMTWLEHDRELLIVRARVTAAAARWEREGRRSDLLLGEGKPLAEAEALAATLGEELPAAEHALIAASRARRQRLKMVRRVAVAALIVLTVAAGLAATYARRQQKIAAQNASVAADNALRAAAGEQQANQARDDLGHTLTETDARIGHLLLEQGRDREALRYAARALRVDASNQAAVTDSLELLCRSPARLLLSHNAVVNWAAFSPDGTRVVTASDDSTARVWDAATGKPLTGPMQHGNVVVTSAAFSPDGTRVVTTSWNPESIDPSATARVWDAATGRPLAKPMRHMDRVQTAAFSPDGTRVVTASDDYRAQVWDAATGKPVGDPMKHDGTVDSAAFSPDGTRVVTICKDTARVWDAATGKLAGNVHPMKHHGAVNSAVFSPDGTKVLTTSEDRTAQLWDAATGKPLAEPMRHERTVTTAAFSPDGTRVVTASSDKTARVWDAATGKPLAEPMQHQQTVTTAAFSPDGTRVVTASWDKTSRVWDAATGKPLGQPMQHEFWVGSAAFSADGKRVVTVASDEYARVWEVASGKPLGEPMRHEAAVWYAEFSSDGTRLVTASVDQTARVWDAATGKPLGEPMRHAQSVWSATFSPDGKRVITASGDADAVSGAARVWDAATGKPLAEAKRVDFVLYWAVFSPDGTRAMIAGGDPDFVEMRGAGDAQVWDLATGKQVGKPMQHKAIVRCAVFSPDGKRVVTASEDSTAQVWDAATGERLGRPMRHRGTVTTAAFSTDGKRVVTASEDYTAQVWDAATGKPLGEPMQQNENVWSATFSPDGTRVVTASAEGIAQIWNAATGKRLGEPMRHVGVTRAAFSPDGNRVVTASEDGTARVWDVAVPAPAGSDFLIQLDELQAERKLGNGGFAEPLADWMALRDNLKRQAESTAATQPAARWMPWFFADRLHRTISPFSGLSVTDWISHRMEENTAAGMRDVWAIDPNNPRCLSRLARTVIRDIPESYSAAAPIYVDLYSRRAAELAPKDAEVLWRRTAMLAWLGRQSEATKLAERCPAPAKDDLWAWEAKWEAAVSLKRDADATAALAATTELATARPKFVRDSLAQNMKDFKSLSARVAATQPATLPLDTSR